MRQEPIWHGTTIDALASIATQGLLPGARTHVHLAGETDSTVGKRAGVTLYRSPNGVILARTVPPGGITAVQALTRRARAREPEFQRWFERPREGAETGSRAPARDP